MLAQGIFNIFIGSSQNLDDCFSMKEDMFGKINFYGVAATKQTLQAVTAYALIQALVLTHQTPFAFTWRGKDPSLPWLLLTPVPIILYSMIVVVRNGCVNLFGTSLPLDGVFTG